MEVDIILKTCTDLNSDFSVISLISDALCIK